MFVNSQSCLSEKKTFLITVTNCLDVVQELRDALAMCWSGADQCNNDLINYREQHLQQEREQAPGTLHDPRMV